MSLPRPRILVTGATSGVGLAAAHRLAESGATLLLHARTEEKGRPVAEEVRRETGNDSVEVVTGDFERLAEVRELARQVEERAPELDVLVNNAGVVEDRRHVTHDGFERTWQVNHLAPFLLTLRLREALRQAGGRVVNVSSQAHAGAAVTPETLSARLRGEGRWRWMEVYGDTKLANILFTRELARREEAITAYALHPGFLDTDIWEGRSSILHRILGWVASTVGGSPETGGEAVRRLALEEVAEESGAWFDKGDPAQPRLPDEAETLARALWEESRRAVGLNG